MRISDWSSDVCSSDLQYPKRCGHYDDKSIVPVKEMAQKIHAVRDAVQDDDFVLIARTDGLAVEGYERTIERAHAYMEAGADVIFVEAPTTVDQIETIARDRSEEHTSELQSQMR